MQSPLTGMQLEFCRRYALIEGRPGAGVDAAIGAGYSNGSRFKARVQASRLLQNDRILEEIERLRNEQPLLSEIISVGEQEVVIESGGSVFDLVGKHPTKEIVEAFMATRPHIDHVRELMRAELLPAPRDANAKEVLSTDSEQPPRAMLTWMLLPEPYSPTLSHL